MTKLKIGIVLLAMFLLTPVKADSGKISPNTLHFLSLIKENQTEKLRSRYNIKSVDNASYVNAFIILNDTTDLSNLTDLGVKINCVVKNIATAQVPVANIVNISGLSSVKYIQIGSKVRKRMVKARLAANVDKVHSGTGLTLPYTGKDVVVGVIDNGFQYDHINFYTSDGTQTRVKRVWNQNVTGTPPTGFSYGTEYKTQETILAAKKDFSDETHATHVTGIAAGGDKNNGNTYYGVAPNADIVMVSYNANDNSTDNVSLADGIKYIYDYATSVNKPCVVNMSLGIHYGPHDGTSAFDQVCDGLQGKGRLLVGAAGNEGADQLHISKTFAAKTDTLRSFFFYSSSTLSAEADIWGDTNKDFQIKVVIYNKSTSKISFTTPLLQASTANDKEYSVTSTTNGAAGKIYVYTERYSEQ
ncbi:MAG: S8 family serine peptidase [Paludibacteraceae bacterium]